jgi:hypothetical protein
MGSLVLLGAWMRAVVQGCLLLWHPPSCPFQRQTNSACPHLLFLFRVLYCRKIHHHPPVGPKLETWQSSWISHTHSVFTLSVTKFSSVFLSIFLYHMRQHGVISRCRSTEILHGPYILLFSLKKERSSGTWSSMDEPWGHYKYCMILLIWDTWTSQNHRDKVEWWFPGIGVGKERKSYYKIGVEFPLCKMKRIWALVGGNGYTTIWTY